MLKKRIIPCLDIKNGRTVKGVNFVELRDAGDPVELACRYEEEGADELVFLDISATDERRATLLPLVERIAHEVSIPFTVGGGISSVGDVSNILQAGADKVTINSAAVYRPELISELSKEFGSQCVVVSLDSKRLKDDWFIFTHGGKQITENRTLDWANEVVDRGAGELLLTSMDRDGTKIGFDLAITEEVCNRVTVPVVASGGAGTKAHFKEVFEKTSATGGLAASIFHFGEIPIPELKDYLKQQNIPIR